MSFNEEDFVQEIERLGKIVTDNKISFVTDYVIRKYRKINVGSHLSKNTRESNAKTVLRITKERECARAMLKSLRFLSRKNLSHGALIRIQNVVLSVLDACLDKGYLEEAKELTQVIAYHRLERDDARIENNQGVVHDALIRLVEGCDRRDSRNVPNLTEYESGVLNLGELQDDELRVDELIDSIYNGVCGEEWVGDDSFYEYLATKYNHFLESSYPSMDYCFNPTRVLYRNFIMKYVDRKRVSTIPQPKRPATSESPTDESLIGFSWEDLMEEN